MKRVLITQSNYIPWKGYFDNIAQCDVFVVYDDMQYTRRDWRNRNQIKTRDGLQWLTVPVEVKGKFDQVIHATKIDGDKWIREHLERLRHSYSKAPHFKEVHTWLTDAYLGQSFETITDLNVHLLKKVCDRLGVETEFRDSREFNLRGDRTERLVNLCKDLKVVEYLTGPAAKAYFDTSLMDQAGISVIWAEYSGYPEYEQVFPPFTHQVSVLDLLYHTGSSAPRYMKFSRQQTEMA